MSSGEVRRSLLLPLLYNDDNTIVSLHSRSFYETSAPDSQSMHILYIWNTRTRFTLLLVHFYSMFQF